MDCLRAVHHAAHELYDELRGRVPVRLSHGRAGRRRLGRGRRRAACDLPRRRADPQRHVDPGLIGGLVVRVGDTVYDGSVANQFEQVRQQMIDRSVHEIQSRRNRFRDPAGD